MISYYTINLFMVTSLGVLVVSEDNLYLKGLVSLQMLLTGAIPHITKKYPAWAKMHVASIVLYCMTIVLFLFFRVYMGSK